MEIPGVIGYKKAKQLHVNKIVVLKKLPRDFQ